MSWARGSISMRDRVWYSRGSSAVGSTLTKSPSVSSEVFLYCSYCMGKFCPHTAGSYVESSSSTTFVNGCLASSLCWKILVSSHVSPAAATATKSRTTTGTHLLRGPVHVVAFFSPVLPGEDVRSAASVLVGLSLFSVVGLISPHLLCPTPSWQRRQDIRWPLCSELFFA